MDWRAPSWQESLDKYHCWLEKEDTESLEKWGKSRLLLRCCCHPHCVAAGRTLERWRSEACVARCGWGYGTVPASCAVGWTRCAVVPGQEGALDGTKGRLKFVKNYWNRKDYFLLPRLVIYLIRCMRLQHMTTQNPICNFHWAKRLILVNSYYLFYLLFLSSRTRSQCWRQRSSWWTHCCKRSHNEHSRRLFYNDR